VTVEQSAARPQAAGLVTPLIQAVMEDAFFLGGQWDRSAV